MASIYYFNRRKLKLYMIVKMELRVFQWWIVNMLWTLIYRFLSPESSSLVIKFNYGQYIIVVII